MGSPNWSKIPFDKLPEWKKEEMLKNSKETIKKIESSLTCEKCGKECKSNAGLAVHLKSHK